MAPSEFLNAAIHPLLKESSVIIQPHEHKQAVIFEMTMIDFLQIYSIFVQIVAKKKSLFGVSACLG